MFLAFQPPRKINTRKLHTEFIARANLFYFRWASASTSQNRNEKKIKKWNQQSIDDNSFNLWLLTLELFLFVLHSHSSHSLSYQIWIFFQFFLFLFSDYDFISFLLSQFQFGFEVKDRSAK